MVSFDCGYLRCVHDNKNVLMLVTLRFVSKRAKLSLRGWESDDIPCQRLPLICPPCHRGIHTNHPLHLPTSEQGTSSVLGVGNAHDTFMHPKIHASFAIHQGPGFHVNNSAPSEMCDNSVSQSYNQYGATHACILARGR